VRVREEASGHDSGQVNVKQVIRVMRGGSGWGLAALLLVSALQPKVVRAEVIAEAAFATHYIYRGLDNLGGSPAFQPTVTWIAPRGGFDLNAWFSTGLADRGSQAVRDFDEIDLSASYSRQLGDLLLRGGLFHLSWYGRSGYPDDFSTVQEVFAGASLTHLPGQPSLMVNYELAATDGHDLYLQFRCGQMVGFGEYHYLFLGFSAGYYAAEWVGKNGISDINLELSTTLERGLLALTPRFMVTYAPMDEINPNHLIFWSSISLARVWP